LSYYFVVDEWVRYKSIGRKVQTLKIKLFSFFLLLFLLYFQKDTVQFLEDSAGTPKSLEFLSKLVKFAYKAKGGINNRWGGWGLIWPQPALIGPTAKPAE